MGAKSDTEETSFSSTSAQKLMHSQDTDVPIDPTHAYRIVQLYSVLCAISNVVICRECKADIKFSETAGEGLGFEIVVSCECGITKINSCPKIDNKAFEINRRIILTMRLIGIGFTGLTTFIGCMDIANIFDRDIYYSILQNIHYASKAVFHVLTRKAVNEERQKNSEAGNSMDILTVSGDGTWSKKGFTSLFGVTTLIGKYSSKVLDLVVNSKCCKACEIWKNKLDTEEYFTWKQEHDDECTINHIKTLKKMEVNAIIEMFSTSIEKYGVRYGQYICNGDSKTFKRILNTKPYGDDLRVLKKEYIGHFGKRMASRLRSIKEKNKGTRDRRKGNFNWKTYY